MMPEAKKQVEEIFGVGLQEDKDGNVVLDHVAIVPTKPPERGKVIDLDADAIPDDVKPPKDGLLSRFRNRLRNLLSKKN